MTFRRVGAATADVLIARGWRRMGWHKGSDYENHLMMYREREDGPGGPDGYGGE